MMAVIAKPDKIFVIIIVSILINMMNNKHFLIVYITQPTPLRRIGFNVFAITAISMLPVWVLFPNKLSILPGYTALF
jgi:hypothetical protein